MNEICPIAFHISRCGRSRWTLTEIYWKRLIGESGSTDLIATVADISLSAGMIAFFTVLNQKVGQELSLDAAGLIVVASAAGLVIAFRKLA